MPGAKVDRSRAVDGVLLLDKPSGPTSNHALQRARRLFDARKAGHAGTLDPLATGLLPILFGEATKFAAYLSDATKGYEATILLGTRTTTGDLAGEVIEQRSVCVTAQAFESAAAQFRGAISQIPPMHSALKLDGQPLYRLARRGLVVDRAAREVRIDELAVSALRDSEADVRVQCSKGTYIRALAEDIGRVLGCGATLKRLRRIRVGPFDVSAAYSLDSLQEATDADRLRVLRPVEAGLELVPKLALEALEARRIGDGQIVVVEEAQAMTGTVRLYDRGTDRFLGLGECAAGAVRPLRLIAGK